MTDYKNELEQILDVLMAETHNQISDDVLRPDQITHFTNFRGFQKEAVAKLEALLSQHSKERELEAELKLLKLLEHLYTSDPKYTYAAVMDLLQDHKDRIKQLGGQDE